MVGDGSLRSLRVKRLLARGDKPPVQDGVTMTSQHVSDPAQVATTRKLLNPTVDVGFFVVHFWFALADGRAIVNGSKQETQGFVVSIGSVVRQQNGQQQQRCPDCQIQIVDQTADARAGHQAATWSSAADRSRT